MPLLFGLALLVGVPSERLVAEDLPDLVITDIYLAPTPKRFADKDVVFVGTKVRNDGQDTGGDISVSCSFSCRGDSERYFGSVTPLAGLPSRAEAYLFDTTPLDISGCYFSSQRRFTCTVDDIGDIAESDEANNSLSKMLATGK